MTSTRHKWGERNEISPQRTEYPCSRCGALKISRHEFEGGRELHWKEFWRGGVRLDQGGATPRCDAALEAGSVAAQLPEGGSPQLLRALVRQNEDTLRDLLAVPPADPGSAAGLQWRAMVDRLRAETRTLNARLDRLRRDPPASRQRRSWRDIPAPGTWKPTL